MKKILLPFFTTIAFPVVALDVDKFDIEGITLNMDSQKALKIIQEKCNEKKENFKKHNQTTTDKKLSLI